MKLSIAIAATLAAVSLASPGLVPCAAAFEGGGRKPSEAPLVTFGQHYSGQLNNHFSDANDPGEYTEIAFWRLPPLTTHDLVTVNWHELPDTHSEFRVCLILAQNIDDFSWGGVFRSTAEHSCDEDGPVYSVSGSGSAQTPITVQETTPTSYLEFYSHASETEPSRLETYPYDFSVEAPRHFLGVAFVPASAIAANGTLDATATRADGSPAPDGLSFTLTATWRDGGIATYSAPTSGGKLGFPLALPETAVGKKVTFSIARPADAEYQAASSTKLVLPVEGPTASPAAVACKKAKGRVRSLVRQHLRLARHRRLALGPARRRLRRQVRQVAHRLHVARSRAAVVCAS